MNRPLTDQMEELKAKIALLGKRNFEVLLSCSKFSSLLACTDFIIICFFVAKYLSVRVTEDEKHSCADPESFFRVGPTLTIFLGDEPVMYFDAHLFWRTFHFLQTYKATLFNLQFSSIAEVEWH